MLIQIDFVSGDDEWMEPGSPKVDGSGKGLRVAIIDFDHADPVGWMEVTWRFLKGTS